MEKIDGIVEGKYFVGGGTQGKVGYFEPANDGRRYQDDQEIGSGKMPRTRLGLFVGRVVGPKVIGPECDRCEPGKRNPRAVQMGGNNPTKYTAESEWNRQPPETWLE
jgi:hypothetical protein